MENNDTILVVDDERSIRKLLDITLTANNFKVIDASNGNEGLVLAATHHPSLIILDLGLPDIDGQEIIKGLRGWYSKPILVLSVRNTEEDIIAALDNGANDYLTKPFRTGELLARIRVAIRQDNSTTDDPCHKFDNLIIDLNKHIVTKNNEIVKLTATEFSMLSLFVRNEGRVLTHQYILKEVWGSQYGHQTQYLRVFIAQLRKKLEDNPNRPKLFITESGIGYRFGM